MPKATVRANARTLPEADKHPDAALIALAERCEAAAKLADVASDAYARAEFASPHNEAEEAEALRLQGIALDELRDPLYAVGMDESLDCRWSARQGEGVEIRLS
jgi:hypothetical protein